MTGMSSKFVFEGFTGKSSATVIIFLFGQNCSKQSVLPASTSSCEWNFSQMDVIKISIQIIIRKLKFRCLEDGKLKWFPLS
jgi:hypothetical protein